MMGMNSIWHWLIVLLVVVLLFGAGRISGVMGDLGRGIKSFKKGLNEDDEPGSGTGPKPQPRIGEDRVNDTRTTSATSSADLDKR
jgi:sec-independent protein translocase protein TatA